jgi:hypothetical protein
LPIKKEKEEKQEGNTKPNQNPGVNPSSGKRKAYTVAGEYKAIKDIVEYYGSEIIGGFHKTIDVEAEVDGKMTGICYIRTPEAKFEKEMLEKFREKNILVWPKKEVKLSTNGYELDLTKEEDLQFVIDNKDRIKFLSSPEIENNSEESIYPATISYVLPKGCYCMPDGNRVGTPNKCKMGVKIDTVNTNKKNNRQISRDDLEIIITNHHEERQPEA